MTGVTGSPASPQEASFHDFMIRARQADQLVVQPRMGFSDQGMMRAGLEATKAARARTLGTVTLDSYTRTGNFAAAAHAQREGIGLNGYPLVTTDPRVTAAVLHGVRDSDFPVQVRHGSAAPTRIFEALIGAGLDATEGGPVSYCLPYSRRPLRLAIADWARSCRRLATLRERGFEPHLESFGGCMLGQLCPPSLLIAITVLEALFFRQYGLRSVSVSYTQQTNDRQDLEGLQALRSICAELLPDVEWHIVVYTYMGLFPRTEPGARRILRAAAQLARSGGADRLIVKTTAEAERIPTITENVAALELAGKAAASIRRADVPDTGIRQEARVLLDVVLNLDEDIGNALLRAFTRGYLDVPYCIHPDNHAATTATIDADGWLRWDDIGALPISHPGRRRTAPSLTSEGLLKALSYVQRSYDAPRYGP